MDRAAFRRRASLVDRFKYLIGGTKVYALVGRSGTGKSFRAKLVAEEFGIDYIIDDGLLIQGNSIVAGKSAKREAVYMSAVRTALFDNLQHRDEVLKAIHSRKVRKVLLLGTSERMVTLTAERLGLSPPAKVVFIEEVSSEEDIEKAQRSRNEEGKHIIPVPSIEVERDYPHLFSNSIKVLFTLGQRLKRKHGKDHMIYEKSVVQPPFHSGKGRVAISRQALGEMIAHCVDEFTGKLIVRKLRIRSTRHGEYHIRAEVEAAYGGALTDNLHELQNYVVNRIEKFTGILIAEFNVIISTVSKRGQNRGKPRQSPEVYSSSEDTDDEE